MSTFSVYDVVSDLLSQEDMPETNITLREMSLADFCKLEKLVAEEKYRRMNICKMKISNYEKDLAMLRSDPA